MQMRSVVEVVVQGVRLRGTMHEAERRLDIGRECPGVIMLSSGIVPRSGQGDFAVSLGDALAGCGVDAVRIDLTGLGDSEGYLAQDTFEYTACVQEGGFAEVACGCVEALKQQLGWKKAIVGGHCGGAISAFYAVGLRGSALAEGLFALDPIFNITADANSTPSTTKSSGLAQIWNLRGEVLRREVRTMLLRTPLGTPLQRIARKAQLVRRDAKKASAAALTDGRLPNEANLKLLKSAEAALSTGMPVLFVSAEDSRKQREFDYVSWVVSHFSGRVTHARVVGTDHAFLGGGGKPRAINAVLAWLSDNFLKLSSDSFAGEKYRSKAAWDPEES